jgi:hypothetical protein
VGNNRQNPGPLFHLGLDKEDVVHAETGGFRFQVRRLWGLWRKLEFLPICQFGANGQGFIFMDILVGLARVG